MRIAVTGATGFVGRHVLRVLAARSDLEVVVSSRRAAAAAELPAGFRYVAMDIAAPSEEDFDRLGRPEMLLHLAWAGLPNYRSLHHFESELPQQYAFLRSLIGSGLSGLFVAGTCYEYGMTHGELAETVEAAPSNPYAFAKVALRQQLEFLRGTHPFALTWARLFYMYGDGQPAASLYSQLSAAVARGDSSFAMSKGEQLRDFLPVQKVALSIVELALGHRDAGVVNVCSGQPVSVRALVERWKAENGWGIALDLGKYPYLSHEPLALWGSTKKLHALLGTPGDRQAG